MDIVELVVAVCLVANPAACEERRFQFFREGGLTGCMIRATPYLADWTAAHPEWAVKSWKCGVPRTDKDA